jgi:lipopolysaccharide biosynthesis glycosyltransferase
MEYIYMMKKIHKKSSPRIEIGEPFQRLVIDELLKSTNTNNLSSDWNSTDMTRYALAELFKRTGKPLPRECQELLPRFYADLNL